jgi:hypothetical protein
MNINDYLIDPTGKDWAKLLSFWVPPLPVKCTVWLVNRLGEVFAVSDEQRVLRLELGLGTCSEVALSREHFAQQLDRPENTDTWLRIRLVNACRQMGMNLNSKQCYGFKLPPTLGGKYEPSNLTPTDLAVHYSYQAYICKQQDIYWVPPR